MSTLHGSTASLAWEIRWSLFLSPRLCLVNLGLSELTSKAPPRWQRKYWNYSLQMGNKPQSKPPLPTRPPKGTSSPWDTSPQLTCRQQGNFTYSGASCLPSGERSKVIPYRWGWKGTPVPIPPIPLSTPQCFSNFRVPSESLEDLLKHTLLSPTPRISNPIGLGCPPKKSASLTSSQMMPLLLVWGP